MSKAPEQMFFVERGTLFRPDGRPVCDLTGRTGFVDWLKRNKSFRYQSLAGVEISVIKEQRKGRTGEYFDYWYAHRRVFGQLVRVYVGKAEKVTISALEQAAGRLAQLELGKSGGGWKKERPVVRQESSPGRPAHLGAERGAGSRENKNAPDDTDSIEARGVFRQRELF